MIVSRAESGGVNETENQMKQVSRAILYVVMVILAISTAQAQKRASLDRQQLIDAAREIITSARYCALITNDSSGHAQARTVDPFPPDDSFVVWIGTNPRTRKVAEIRRNSHVTLYYFDRDAEAYVTIHGVARLVNDPKEKAKRFKKEWKDFYPNRDKDYLLISVMPVQLEIVSVKQGIVGDRLTWKPPSVTFRKRK
jgi:general stress protein 26